MDYNDLVDFFYKYMKTQKKKNGTISNIQSLT